MKKYTVYYTEKLRSGILITEVQASSEEEAIEIASKKVYIHKAYLTTNPDLINDFTEMKKRRLKRNIKQKPKEWFFKL